MEYKKIMKRLKDRVKYGCDMENFEYLNSYSYIKENNERLRMNLLISTVDKTKMYGGLSTALKFFEEIVSKCNCDARILVADVPVTNVMMNDYKEYTLEKGISYSKKQILDLTMLKRNKKDCPIRPNDILIATYWTTMYLAKDIREFQLNAYSKKNKILYFIQDYEPGFYKWSSEYLLAESTYHFGDIIAVVNSSNLYNYLQLQGYFFSYSFYFEPRMNRTLRDQLLSKKNDSIHREDMLIIYGRPFNGRNCFSLIVAALKLLITKHPELENWKFVSIGTQHKDIRLYGNCYLISRGKLSLKDYAKILLEAKVGVSLMCSPHPSYPPLEMASFGVKTVTNKYICKDLANFSENILSVSPLTIDNLSEAIWTQINSCEGVIDFNSSYLDTNNLFSKIAVELVDIFNKEGINNYDLSSS